MSRVHHFLTKLDLPPDVERSVVSGPKLNGGRLKTGGKRKGCFPANQAIPLNQDLKLILLSTHDNSLEIFFNPQTREFYTITTENESEDDEQGETLLTDASQLAHSAYGFHGLSPTHHSISTAGDRRGRTHSRVRFRTSPSPTDRGRASGSQGEGGRGGESPTRRAPPTSQDGRGGWATVDDLRTLVASINEGHERIIAAIQSNTRGGRRGVDLQAPATENSVRSERRAPPVGNTRPIFENELSYHIREHIDSLTPSARAGVRTVSAGDFNGFDPQQGIECCTASDLRFNLDGTPCDKWNKSATRVFVNHFLETYKQYPAHNRAVRSMVQKKTAAAIKSLIKSYRSKSVGEAEFEDSEVKRKRRERKRQLFLRRRNTACFYPALVSQLEKLDELGVSGMSSDEESNSDGIKRFRILKPRWRAERVTAWLRFFDALYNHARRNRLFGSSRGAMPRDRKSARTHSTNNHFVVGLPRNAYDPRWLRERIDIENIVQPGPDAPWAHDPAIYELVVGAQARRAAGEDYMNVG